MTGFQRQSLGKLLSGLPIRLEATLPNLIISGITLDSRLVQPGNLFIALQGKNTDGHQYIPMAVERGAAAVVGTQPLERLPVPYIRVSDARVTLAHLAAAFYDFPATQMTMIGVTGTDGKTTTSNLVYQILLSAGYRSGIISTVSATIGKEVLDTGFHVTTPEAPDVQRYLFRMRVAGITHVVLEATSHGLAQHRVTNCEFDVGVITNITHEHLDFHGSYDSYRESKARLFTGLEKTREKIMGNLRLAVLNQDDVSFDYLSSVTSGKKISYSLKPGAMVWAEDISCSSDGIQFVAHGPGFVKAINSRLLGEFNVSNCLAALATTVVGLDVPIDTAAQAIAVSTQVPGRMECIQLGQSFTAIVDFAHTPNALRKVLTAARCLTSGRVLAVFGSAGLRDREKRRMMAAVAAEMADCSILTAEDPRSESLDSILAEMAQGAETTGGVEGQTYWRIPDRGEALRTAVQMARPGDLVIACGKGHEQSMCFGETEYNWDDRVAMRAVIAELLGIPGPEMPYLPTQGPRAA